MDESGQGPQPLIEGGLPLQAAAGSADVVFRSAMVRNIKREGYTVMRSH